MDKPNAILFDFGDTLLGDLKFNPLAGNTHLLEKFAEGRGNLRPEDIQEAAVILGKELRPVSDPSLIELTTSAVQSTSLRSIQHYLPSGSRNDRAGILESLGVLHA